MVHHSQGWQVPHVPPQPSGPRALSMRSGAQATQLPSAQTKPGAQVPQTSSTQP